MAILNTRLTTTDATEVFRANGQEAVTVMYICNNTASDVTVQVYCIADDGSTGGSQLNIIYSDLAITGHDTYVISTEKIVFDINDYMQVEANIADAITVTVSSVAL